MNFIFLGPQGSGKSTQAKMLSENLTIPYIDMGQTFRDKAKDGSEDGKTIKASLDSGELVPDEITIRTLNEKLNEEKFQHGFILDGYPRNRAQLEGLNKNINKVFYVKVSDQEAIKRLSLRARHDDTEELLKRRLDIYHGKTEPLLSIFREKGVLIDINGEKSIKAVNKEVLEKAK